MNDTFWTGAIIFAFALGSMSGAAAGFAFFGLMLMFGGFANWCNTPIKQSDKDED